MHKRLAVMVATMVSMVLIVLVVGCSSQSSKASAPPAPNLHGKIVFIREARIIHERSGGLRYACGKTDGYA